MKLRSLNPDGRLLFSTRMARLFAYGFLSVVLALYLHALNFTDTQIGLLLSLTLVGDTIISLWITTNADRIGRRKMLMAGAALMVFAALLFILTQNYILLVIAATIGVISPSGNEVGPFLSIEQAALSQLLPGEQRTQVFAWYNLVGSFATALGALCGGGLSRLLQVSGTPAAQSYRFVILGYALVGLLLEGLFNRLSSAAEAPPTVNSRARTLTQNWLGLHKSRRVVLKPTFRTYR